MKNKIGKYSTGLGKMTKQSGSPYGQSNKGYDARQNLMGQIAKSAPMKMSPKGTATGKPVLVKGD